VFALLILSFMYASRADFLIPKGQGISFLVTYLSPKFLKVQLAFSLMKC
jgi:hypothetical protein